MVLMCSCSAAIADSRTAVKEVGGIKYYAKVYRDANNAQKYQTFCEVGVGKSTSTLNEVNNDFSKLKFTRSLGSKTWFGLTSSELRTCQQAKACIISANHKDC